MIDVDHFRSATASTPSLPEFGSDKSERAMQELATINRPDGSPVPVVWPKPMHPNGHGDINEDEAAAYLGVSVSLLRKWRRDDEGPPWHRLGRIKYPLNGLNEHIELSMRRPSR